MRNTMVAATEICEERVTIPAASGPLDGILAYPLAGSAAVSALIAGPHPLLGGNAENNVVRALRQALAEAGCAALTFAYRPLEALESGPRDWSAITTAFWRDGRFAEEHEWVTDLRNAAKALRRWCGARPPVLVGYSFGCWASALLSESTEPPALVLISPNAKQHDFGALAHSTAPLFVVHADNDFTCDEQSAARWFDTLREPKSRSVLCAGEHFFRGSEPLLAETVLTFLGACGICGAVQ